MGAEKVGGQGELILRYLKILFFLLKNNLENLN